MFGTTFAKLLWTSARQRTPIVTLKSVLLSFIFLLHLVFQIAVVLRVLFIIELLG